MNTQVNVMRAALEDIAMNHENNAITQEGLAISNRARGFEWLTRGGIKIVKEQERAAQWHRMMESKARAGIAAAEAAK